MNFLWNRKNVWLFCAGTDSESVVVLWMFPKEEKTVKNVEKTCKKVLTSGTWYDIITELSERDTGEPEGSRMTRKAV